MSNSKLCDLPLPLTSGHYEEASQEFCQNVLAGSPEASVYRFGSVSTPGISDIDMVAVFPDGVSVRMSDMSEKRLKPIYRKLFVHGPVVVTKSQFRQLPLFYPNVSVQHFVGPQLEIDPLNDEEKKILGLIVGIEILPTRWYEVARILTSESLEVRRALMILNSVRRSIQHLSDWDIEHRQWSDFATEVQSIRADCSYKIDADRIRNVLGLGERIIRQLFVTMNKLLDSQLDTISDGASYEFTAFHGNAFRVTLHTKLIESPDFPVTDLMEIWKRHAWKGRLCRPQLCISHPGLLRHVDVLLACKPPFSGELLARLKPKPDVTLTEDSQCRYAQLAYRRAMLCWPGNPLRPVAKHGIFHNGLAGPLWSDIEQPIEYVPSSKERLRNFAREVLIRSQKLKIKRALKEIGTLLGSSKTFWE